jgi:hypothetical protein
MFGKVKQGNVVKELFESRERAEEEAAARARASTSNSGRNNTHALPRNRLHVSSLVTLLEERLHVSSVGAAGSAVKPLADKYGMDVQKLESLARFVNVPRPSVRWYVESGEQGVAITEVSSLSPQKDLVSFLLITESFFNY